MSMLEKKSDKKVKFKQKMDKKEKGSADNKSTDEDGQFEEKLDGRTEKKRKKKNKKEEKTERSVTDVVKQNMEKMKKKKKKDTEEMEGSRVNTVEKKHSKRKRATDGEDLGKHEKKRSKSTINGLDKDICAENIIDSSNNKLKKKEKRENFRDTGAIELKGRNKNENGDNMLREKKEDKNVVKQRKERKRKKEKSGSSCNIERKINEEEKADNVRKGEEKKDGSKTNKSFKKASKSEKKCKRENKEKAKGTTGTNDEVKNTENLKGRKKVQFSDKVEVFSAPSDSIKKSERRHGDETEDMVWARRFTKEEDEVLLKAIDDYIQVKQLGDQGRGMIYNCRKHKQLRGCWKEISTCLPYRPCSTIYFRARVLLSRNATDWTPEEYESLRKFQAIHGNQWKKFAELHSKNSKSVKDAWRSIKNVEEKNGPWSADEYQTLFHLVNLDLKLKAFTEKPETHAFLRDNISWEAISEKLGTRDHSKCCHKWYHQLSSTMVRDNLWSDVDDYRLILALEKVDASCIEEVDWDNLLPHREGEICMKRWLQMVRHLGEHKERPFIEKVEILAKRYCSEMVEYRFEKDED